MPQSLNKLPLMLATVIGLGIGFYVLLLARILWPLNQSQLQSADAILVLGTQLSTPNQADSCLIARVNRAMEVFHQDLADTIILSGGDEKGIGITEAEAMSHIAVSAGIPDTQIVIEPKATSTYENLIYSKELMATHSIESLLVVTESFHAPRAQAVADSLDMPIQVVTSTIQCRSATELLWLRLVREPVAFGYYLLLGWIKLW